MGCCWRYAILSMIVAVVYIRISTCAVFLIDYADEMVTEEIKAVCDNLCEALRLREKHLFMPDNEYGCFSEAPAPMSYINVKAAPKVGWTDLNACRSAEMCHSQELLGPLEV